MSSFTHARVPDTQPTTNAATCRPRSMSDHYTLRSRGSASLLLLAVAVVAAAPPPPPAPRDTAPSHELRPAVPDRHRRLAAFAWSGSPDPNCLIRINRVKHLWLYEELPVIYNHTQLSASPWQEYLHTVYGAFESRDFPIDLRCFTFWYKHHLPMSVEATFLSHYISHADALAQGGARDGDVVDVGYRHLAWQIYYLVHDPAGNHSWPVDPNEQRAILLQKDGVTEGRIEVFHDMDDCRWASNGGGRPEPGYWVHFAPGSGVYLPLGHSQITGDSGYWQACNEIFGQDSSTCHSGTIPIQDALWRHAHRAGIDSLQSCCGHRGDDLATNYFEMTFYGAHCWPRTFAVSGICTDAKLTITSNGACPIGMELTTGRSGDRPCLCDPTLSAVNCDATLRNPPAGLCGGRFDLNPHKHDQTLDWACLPRLTVPSSAVLQNLDRVRIQSNGSTAESSASCDKHESQFGCVKPGCPPPTPQPPDFPSEPSKPTSSSSFPPPAMILRASWTSATDWVVAAGGSMVVLATCVVWVLVCICRRRHTARRTPPNLHAQHIIGPVSLAGKRGGRTTTRQYTRFGDNGSSEGVDYFVGCEEELCAEFIYELAIVVTRANGRARSLQPAGAAVISHLFEREKALFQFRWWGDSFVSRTL